MYDKYIIVEDNFKNVERNGKTVGFQIGARLPYYRGLVISMIENIKVIVDGEQIPSYNITVSLNGNTYTLADMEGIYDQRWEFGEVGFLFIKYSGGLPAGRHLLEIVFSLRISYRPIPLVGSDRKKLTLN